MTERRKQHQGFREVSGGQVGVTPRRRFFGIRAAAIPLAQFMICVCFMLGNLAEASAQTTPRQTTQRDGKRRDGTGKEQGRGGSGSSGPRRRDKFPDVYRVRLFLVDEQGATVDEADIASSIGGESMKVKAGGVYIIPAITVPQDRWLIIIAEKKTASLKGTVRARLTSDPNPSLTITMQEDKSAFISGAVVDESGGAIEGAKVNVAGHPAEETTTDSNGSFKLPAHRAKNRMIRLYVRKDGYEPSGDWQMAGDQPVEVKLKRRKP
jgi:Carboxypeptidase regulatory-like domain